MKAKRERYEVRLLRAAVVVNGLVPLAFLVWDGVRERLGANPVELVLRTTGTLTLVGLLLTLAVTPVKRWLGVPTLARARRWLGLYAFFYGCLHVGTYVWLDKFFSVRGIAEDVVTRPFVTVGFVAFVLMIPQAVTSTDGWVKKLGKERWQKIHRRVYALTILGVVHAWMGTKADVSRPLAYALVLAVLLGARLVWRAQAAARGDGVGVKE